MTSSSSSRPLKGSPRSRAGSWRRRPTARSTPAASASVGAMSILESRASLLTGSHPRPGHVEGRPRGRWRVLQREALLAPGHAVVGHEDEERRSLALGLGGRHLAHGAVDDQERLAHLAESPASRPGRHRAHLARVRAGRVRGWLEGRQRCAGLRSLVAAHDLRRVALLARGLADVRRTERDPGEERLVGRSLAHLAHGFLADDVVAEAAPVAHRPAVPPEARLGLRAEHEGLVPAGRHDRAVVAIEVLAGHGRVVARLVQRHGQRLGVVEGSRVVAFDPMVRGCPCPSAARRARGCRAVSGRTCARGAGRPRARARGCWAAARGPDHRSRSPGRRP